MTWPIKNKFSRSAYYAAGNDYAVLVASGGIHTKGNYVELVASTDFNSDLLMLTAPLGQSSYGDFLLDLAIGTAGNEVVIVSNLLILATGDPSFTQGWNRPHTFCFPLYIPAGTRISARNQTEYTTNYINVSIHIFGKELNSGSCAAAIDTIGGNTSDTGGTSLADCGGVANTYGAYTQISASTQRNYKGFFIIPGSRNHALPNISSNFDLAVGDSGFETNIINSLIFTSEGNGHFHPKQSQIFWIPIPAGTRLSARYKSSTTDATDRLADLIFYGLF